MTITIKPCQTYHARVDRVTLLCMPDGLSAFKVYYLSISGRVRPEQYEWTACPRTIREFETAFLASGIEGVGLVTCFPHITKVFRFSPSNETVLDVREFDTATLQSIDAARGEGFHEFACLAEALIAAEEYKAWASARSVDEYLAYRCDLADFPVLSNTKLNEYWPPK
jgi:hypothetical protein